MTTALQHTHLGPSAPRRFASDLALLGARVLLGVVLITHGVQKLRDGVGATAEGFDQMGIPLPEAAAVFAIAAEVGGGALLIIGLFTPIAGLAVVAQMAGAFWFAHRGTELLVTEGGWELVAMIGVGALLVAVVGAGRISADHLLIGPRRRRKAEERLAAHDAEVAAEAVAADRQEDRLVGVHAGSARTDPNDSRSDDPQHSDQD